MNAASKENEIFRSKNTTLFHERSTNYKDQFQFYRSKILYIIIFEKSIFTLKKLKIINEKGNHNTKL